MRILLIVLALAVLPATSRAATPELPKEVKAYLEQREACDHWRGEEGYDKERQADIDWSICQSCQGIDTKLAELKNEYRANKAVMDQLGKLEVRAESPNREKTKRFCSTTRKPKSEE